MTAPSPAAPSWLKSWLRHAPYVLAVFASRWIAAMVVAAGLGSIAAHALGWFPTGDGLLFDPGALMLAEVTRQNWGAIRSVLVQAAMIGIVMIGVGLLTTALLLGSLSSAPAERSAQLIGRVVPHLKKLAMLLALFSVAAAAVALLPYWLAQALSDKLQVACDQRLADIAYASIVAVGLVLAVAVGIVHDLARAAVVALDLDTPRAIVLAWGVAFARPCAVLFAYGSRAAASVLLVVVAADAVAKIGISTATAAVAVALVHQAVVLAITCLRASWLAQAVREVAAPSERQAGERSERYSCS